MRYLALSLALGFMITYIGAPYAKRYLLASGLVAVDQQKQGKPKLPSSGGITVLFGFLVSITSYLAFSVFIRVPNVDTASVLAALNSAILIGLIGLLDDIHVDLKAVIKEELDVRKDDEEVEIHQDIDIETLPHQEFLDKFTGDFSVRDDSEILRNGIGQIPKMLFVLPAALPLIAVGAGSWTMHFPIIGAINWGILYPLVLLPIGLLFVSNVVNMLAGTNGLVASMSLVASTALGVYAYLNGSTEAMLISFSLSVCLLAFLRYNFYPASILPGDVLPYLAGAAMFSAMVIGNMEKFGVFIFAPWFAEFLLKLRGGFKAHSWGILQEDGGLMPQHDHIYSLTHPLMMLGLNEKQITLALAGIETLICVTALILLSLGIL